MSSAGHISMPVFQNRLARRFPKENRERLAIQMAARGFEADVIACRCGVSLPFARKLRKDLIPNPKAPEPD